ncbi:MAG: iron-containing alcohol dehydrogenase [Methylococcales bacterium]|jgi:alcohol dehydrogenase class IV|nr:iron-containing alcohol dehydrogenase [Methylococcales bacterium]
MFHQLYSDIDRHFWRFYSDAKIIACLTVQDSIALIQQSLLSLKTHKPLIISDIGVSQTQAFIELQAELKFPVEQVGYECEEQPIRDIIQLIKTQHYDQIIAIGGGSVLDAAKYISASVFSPALDSILKQHDLNHPRLPVITIPTTFGTGSESNMYSHIKINGIKYSTRKSWLTPDVSLLIGQFGIEQPKSLRILSALDAWLHAFEVLTLKREKSPLNEAILIHALKLHQQSTNDFIASPTCENSLQVATASCMAGMGLNNARTGLIHSLATPYAEIFKLPHAESLIPFIKPVIQYNWHGIKQYFTTYHSDKEFIVMLEKLFLNDAIKLFKNDVKCDESLYEKMTKQCLLDVVLIKENPVELTEQAILKLFKQSIVNDTEVK